ncbi:MAG: PAS domain S-box protein [Lewinella sp.]|nr:PAS domain S-box protein [Lewinella sp.]
MNSSVVHSPSRIAKGLQEAIPTLLATSDFLTNLMNSLQIITNLLEVDSVYFLLCCDEEEDSSSCMKVLFAMNRNKDGWREVIDPAGNSTELRLPQTMSETLREGNSISGIDINELTGLKEIWETHSVQTLQLMPAISNGHLAGVLCFEVEQPIEEEMQPLEKLLLNTYCQTLGNWIKRYEKIKGLRRERDYFRDIINLGSPEDIVDAALKSDWQSSVMDAQLLNRKIASTIPDQIFIIDLLDHSNLYSNKPTFLGYSLDNIDTPFEFFQKLIHPEDIGPAFENFFDRLSRASDNELIESEYRMFTKGGEVVWFSERVKVFKRDKNGQVWQYLNVLQDITKRKEAELAKRESDMLFRSLYEKNPLGVVITDPRGKLIQCNETFAQMLGYTLDEIIDKPIRNITHPEEVNKEMNAIQTAMLENQSIMFMEKRYLHKNGRVIWANLNMSLLYKYTGEFRLAIGMIEDITEKRKIRRALENNEAFQKAILRTLPDLKFRIDKTGYFIDYYPSPNPQEDLLRDPQDFMGKKVDEVLPSYIAVAIMKNIELALETGDLREFEFAMPLENKLNHYEIRVNAVNRMEVIAVVRNVSERNWAQLELQNKIRELDEKNKMLQHYIDSNLQLENFAYIASHDLREPLRTMGTFAQLLQKKYRDKLDQSAHTYINFVVKSARDMNNLIEDLLTYSRIETQENVLEVVDLPDLLQEVVDGLDKAIVESRAVIRFDQIPPNVVANPNRIKQLFQNLMANAIKFRREDLPPVVQVSCNDLGNFWQFEVRDNGIGVDPEFHDKIFLLFKKLHSRQDFQGTGLGLAICRKVVEQLGGEIWLESEEGRGASFFFTIRKQPH